MLQGIAPAALLMLQGIAPAARLMLQGERAVRRAALLEAPHSASVASSSRSTSVKTCKGRGRAGAFILLPVCCRHSVPTGQDTEVTVWSLV